MTFQRYADELQYLEREFAALKEFAAKLYTAGIRPARVTVEWDGAYHDDVELLTPIGSILIRKPHDGPPKPWLETYRAALHGGSDRYEAALAASFAHGEWPRKAHKI